MIKKLIIAASLILALAKVEGAGLITTNLASGTTVVYNARASVYQIDVTSATANLIKIYDTSSNALTYVIGPYTGSSNFTRWTTNIYTNAIFEYATSTQMFLMTNIQLGNWRSNYAVIQTTNAVPAQITLFVPAGLTASIDAVDLNFLNGITVTATNSAQIAIYTR